MSEHREPGSWRIRRSTIDSHIGVALAVVALLALLRLPYVGTSAQMKTAVEILTLLALAQMWNLLAGYAGLISIGQQAWVGIGAYGVLVVADDWGLDPFVAVWVAAGLAAVVSVPIGMLAFRLRGGYFAIGTWVIAEMVLLLVVNNTALGGGNGRTIRSLVSYDRIVREDYTYYMALVVGFGSLLLVTLLLRSRMGLALQAIRDTEGGAAAVGVEVYRAKLVVWVIASTWSALAGGVIYLDRLNVQPTSAFSVQWTAFALFIVVIGGLGSTAGPIIGTFVFWFVRESLADQGEWYLITLGLLAVVVAVVAPKGIYGLLTRAGDVQVFPTRRRLEEGGR